MILSSRYELNVKNSRPIQIIIRQRSKTSRTKVDERHHGRLIGKPHRQWTGIPRMNAVLLMLEIGPSPRSRRQIKHIISFRIRSSHKRPLATHTHARRTIHLIYNSISDNQKECSTFTKNTPIEHMDYPDHLEMTECHERYRSPMSYLIQKLHEIARRPMT